MNVLSLFDGISCGYEALQRAGVHVQKYWASEIDKNAIKIAKKNHPDIRHVGDITNIKNGFEGIELVIGGSPCQGFSFAGKQLNFEDPRSKLFFEFVRILKEVQSINPEVKFLLENVRMKKEYQDVISKYLGVEPIMINSALVSAQNRVRLYWTNIEGVTQPCDKGILLQDILENGVVDRDKSYCLDACYFKGGNVNMYFNKSRRQLVFKDKEVMALAANQVGRRIKDGKRGDKDKSIPIKQRIEVGGEKANCLTTAQKDSMVFLLPDSVRNLTPVECERLQTLPDNYTEGISNSQRYRCLGNGWTVDVLAHIFKNLRPPLITGTKGELEVDNLTELFYKPFKI